MATLLPKKSGPQDNAIATDDEHHEALASDPSVSAFPQGSSFGSTTSGFGSTTAFGSTPSTGFGASSSFGSSVATGSSFGQSGAMAPQPQPNLTAAGSNAAQGADVLVANDKESTDWINKKMRPMMGWIYMLTCTCDLDRKSVV